MRLSKEPERHWVCGLCVPGAMPKIEIEARAAEAACCGRAQECPVHGKAWHWAHLNKEGTAPAWKDGRGLGRIYEIVISPPPLPANRTKGRRWFLHKRQKERILKEVGAQWQAAGRPRFKKAVIHAEWYGWNRPDPGGVIEALKPVVDSLTVKNGVGAIPDDSMRHVRFGRVEGHIERGKNRRPPRVVVRVEEDVW